MRSILRSMIALLMLLCVTPLCRAATPPSSHTPDVDFNNDGTWDAKDWADYQAAYSEADCIGCNSIDYNNDGSSFDPIDMTMFYRDWARLPQDEQGWTPIEISPLATCVYVDSDNGDNTNVGTMSRPLREADVATLFYRVGVPAAVEYHAKRVERAAVLAFKRGTTHPRVSLEFGGTSSVPLIVTSYGDPSLPRPIIRGVSLRAECRGNVWLIDLDIQGPGDGSLGTGVLLEGGQDNVRIEGCNIQGFQNGIGNNDPVTEWTVYRNTILDQWCEKTRGHSQGFGPSRVTGLDVVENIFDLNGWAGRASQRTQFNHGVYGVQTTRDAMFYRNLVSRCSNTGLQLRAEGQNAHDNLFYRNPANLTFGHDATVPDVAPNGLSWGNIIVGTTVGEWWMAGSALGIDACKDLTAVDTVIVGLPGEFEPRIRVEPYPASWTGRTGKFSVRSTRVFSGGQVQAFRSLSPNESIDAVVRDQRLEQLTRIDWDAFVANVRQSRKGDWRWSRELDRVRGLVFNN